MSISGSEPCVATYELTPNTCLKHPHSARRIEAIIEESASFDFSRMQRKCVSIWHAEGTVSTHELAADLRFDKPDIAMRGEALVKQHAVRNFDPVRDQCISARILEPRAAALKRSPNYSTEHIRLTANSSALEMQGSAHDR
jgi:hypothetical protein